jgi:branched-chain amino acid transport system substrate-binding protein
MRPKQATRTRATLCSVLVVVAAAMLLAACGGIRATLSHPAAPKHPHKATPPVVDIYSGLPTGGRGPISVDARAVLSGINLAINRANHQAGVFHIKFEALDDSRPKGTGSDPLLTAENARKVATDPRAVYYIGELGSAATEVALPILNQAGIAEVSPESPYIGLTRQVSDVTSPGEPQKYSTTGHTLLELMPNDAVEADAVLDWLHMAQCKTVPVISQADTQEAGLVKLMQADAKQYGVTLVSVPGWSDKQSSAAAFALTLTRAATDCFVFATPVSKAVASLTKALHADLPKAMIVGTNSLCNRSWTTAAPALYCTEPTLPISKYQGSAVKKFIKLYEKTHHKASPSPYALYGYEAASLGIDTIIQVGRDGDNREVLLGALFYTPHSSLLGTYTFNDKGETSLRYYGLYQANANGTPVFYKKLTPPLPTA